MATQLADLDIHARELATAAIAWMDGYWDAEVGLLWMPDPEPSYADSFGHVQHHIVRETTWYALGLLLRDDAGDRERAFAALESILTYQFDTPDQPYHGTWRLAPEEPDPPAEPQEWRDYDPNWREFIGTTLAIILIEYGDWLPHTLVTDIDTALRRAVVGTITRSVPASYTNIALMSAFLLRFAADRFNQAAWAELGEQLATAIHLSFTAHNSFEEYNSPTYYGVDLYALACWRAYSPSSRVRELGAEMEHALWSDIAQFYHADMQNLSGPFDRSYGMDLRQYASLMGMWIAVAVGIDAAPFPDWHEPFDHSHDFCYAPCLALLGARIPPTALPHLGAFRGERQIERVISTAPRRVASAWIGAEVMLGGEDSAGSKPPTPQFHPATIYWRRGNDIGWIKLTHNAPLDAWAEQGRLALVCYAPQTGDLRVTFQVYPAQTDANTISRERWQLDGLTIQVDTTAPEWSVVQTSRLTEISYTAHVADQPDGMHFALITKQQGSVT